MTITRNFKLCLNAGTQNAPYINVNQYDEGEQWIFDLYTEGGQKFTPSTGAIIGIKSDGNAILNSGTVNSDGQVVITETQQMTAASGLAVFELLIEGETHGTANFIVNVERRPSDDAEFSDSDLSMLQEAIDAAEVINEILDEGGDPSEIITENVNNWLDNHPEATTTVLDGAITAPKINNSLWDKLLVSEEASGAVASFDDGADDVPVSSLKVALEPIQLGSGDPSPSNVRPIIASNGKNLLQNVNSTRTQNGITYTVNADGSVTATGTATSGSYFVFTSANNSINDYTVTIIPSGTSIIASTDSTTVLRVRYTDGTYENLTNGSAKTLTKNIGLVLVEYSSGTTANETIKPMIRLASITDASYQPYQGIMVERTGKNLLPAYSKQSETVNGITLNNNSGEYLFNGTASSRASFDIPFSLNAGTYTVAFNNAVASALGAFSIYLMRGGSVVENLSSRDANAVFQITLTQSIDNCRLTIAGAVTLNNYAVSPIITYQTDSTFEPYIAPTSYPYTLGQSVYGGSVDLATGVLTVDRVGVSLNNPTKWVNSTYTTVDFDYTVNFSDRKKTDDSYAGLMCSYVPANKMQANYCRWYSASGNKFGIKTDGTLTLEQIKSDASAGNIFISYPLDTPTTVQLTPTEVKTLLGYNNISSSGTVDVIYHADTKLYVDKMTAVDNNIIAPTEADFTATRNYTTNDLLIINNVLYKVTTNIANGGTITPNSNVTQTTLSALIKALS